METPAGSHKAEDQRELSEEVPVGAEHGQWTRPGDNHRNLRSRLAPFLPLFTRQLQRVQAWTLQKNTGKKIHWRLEMWLLHTTVTITEVNLGAAARTYGVLMVSFSEPDT